MLSHGSVIMSDNEQWISLGHTLEYQQSKCFTSESKVIVYKNNIIIMICKVSLS